jgi:adenylylsulfate kinase-like enzyme
VGQLAPKWCGLIHHNLQIDNLIPQFTGISSPYEHPINPELTINTESITAEEASDQIIAMLIKAGIIN